MAILLEQKIKILENRKNLIEKLLKGMNESILESVILERPQLEKEFDPADPKAHEKIAGDYWKNVHNRPKPKGFLSKLGQKIRQGAGVVDPSTDVDDPNFTTQNIVKSVKKTRKQLNNFQTTALNTTKNISNLHGKISDLLNKFDRFSETLPQEFRGKAEREVVNLAQKFYSLLNQEKERIDTFMDMIKKDVGESGREGAIAKESNIATVEQLNMNENSDEDKMPRKTISWGAIPDLDELEERMGDEDFNMRLGKQDKLAWDYVMTLAGEAYRSPEKITNSVDMRDILDMLVGSMREEELSDSERDMVKEILEEWHETYHDEEISETAESLASSILDVLGVEWV